MKTTKRQHTALILLTIALIAFICAHICEQQTQIEPPKNMGADEYSILPNPNALIWMSMGQQEFLADLIWVRALQYNNLKNEAHIAENFADAMLALDPDFKAVYQWAAVASLFSENISVRSVETSNHYLRLGSKRFPLDPYYDYTIAINNISYYPEDGPRSEDERRSEAITYLQSAMQKPGADPNISMLISGLLNDDDISMKIQFLQQAVLTEQDPAIKRNLQTRLILLSESSDASGLILAAKRDQWHRDHHEYLPLMLDFMIAGEE
ncbi:MAG: hypothetical protein J6S69_09165 [Proteobacteria bacterium]|nr:hypothetical protein [Pseudomonadota bacterium]